MSTLTLIHVGAALASILGFFGRGLWMIQDSPRRRERWVRILPHVVDTVLLGSAIALAVRIHQYPGVHAWLTAKVAALLIYIVLGSIALKRGRTKSQRVIAWVGAMLVFAYIVGVARTRSAGLGLIAL
ncbi:MAG TPA: SirB2 family protein [Acidiferrobacterales bacterium]